MSTSHRRRQQRVPDVQVCEARLLLTAGLGEPAAGFGSSLGAYLRPGLIENIRTPGPRLSRPALRVDPQLALSQQLGQELGGLARLARQVDFAGAGTRSAVAAGVINQPFVRSLLSSLDTYRLLDSQALDIPFGTLEEASPSDLTNFELIVADDGSELITIGGLTTDDLLNSMVGNTSVATIAPGGLGPGIDGFQVEIPNSQIRFRSDGEVIVTTELANLPTAVQNQIAEADTLVQFRLPPLGLSVGPQLTSLVRGTAPLTSPNVVRSVPGFDVLDEVTRVAFPNGVRSPLGRVLRIAADRRVFDELDPSQVEAIREGTDLFLRDLRTYLEAGAFSPTSPPRAIEAAPEPLGGSLAITQGIERQLMSVDAGSPGHDLGEIGEFPGRIDVGVIFDPLGNYGIILTARNPLQNTLPEPQSSSDQLAGEIRVEVSNTASFSNLNTNPATLPLAELGEPLPPLESVQGGFLGSALSGTVERGQTPDVQYASASLGYGVGFSAGTGLRYTRIIPLGNVFFLR